MVAGVTLHVGGSKDSNEWAFVCASVGDCKVFTIEHDTSRVRDVTEGNKDTIESATDPGGRLGPVCHEEESSDVGPDLRNLRVRLLLNDWSYTHDL